MSNGNIITKFYSHHKQAFHWLLVSLVIVRLLEIFVPFLSNLDRSFLDLFARLHAVPTASEIYIVEITDEDYKNIFCSRSPLDHAIVKDLIQSIAKAGPAVIGVDLDTGGDEWADYRAPTRGTGDAGPQTAIVWAGVPTNLSDLGKAGSDFEVECPLGGSRSNTWSGSDETLPSGIGLVILPEDDDGRVRGHRRDFPDAKLTCGKGGLYKLVPFDVAVKAACYKNWRCRQSLHHPSEPWTEKLVRFFQNRPLTKEYVNFWGERYRFQVIQASEFLNPSPELKKARADLLQNHIVLVGGAYSAARDDYWTPFGSMRGVELLASGIHSAASGYILPSDWPPVYLFSIVVDLALGIFVIWIASILRPGTTNERIVAILGSIVPFYLLYKFYSSNVWLGAVPVVAGVCLERIHALYEERNELRKDLERLKKSQIEVRTSSAEEHIREEDHQIVKLADGTVVEDVVEHERDSTQSITATHPKHSRKPSQ
ncbi:MAG TPA: CHASE2 domain-containing protein [Candidatus Sulfotelmatobacter sp.]